MSYIEVDDPAFVDDLLESKKAVQVVAQWLSGFGYSIQMPDIRVRPTVADRFGYSDDGDLFIAGWGRPRRRVEVKRRTFSFTSAEDYPYGTLIVDAAHCWENADPKPCAYVILNSDCSHAAVVLATTRPRWNLTERWDRAKSRHRRFYEVAVSCARFYRLPRSAMIAANASQTSRLDNNQA